MGPRRGPRRTLAAARRLTVLAAAFLAGKPVGLDIECKDPLFETHWFGKTDIPTLNALPTVKTGLMTCPQYNSRESCCSEGFEEEQNKYYKYYKDIIFASKLARVATHRASVADVRRTASYSVATYTEREQYRRALETFAPVLNPDVHAECFSTLLTYAAGMNCFACKPDWFRYVDRRGGSVIRVGIDPAVCVEVWSRCETFSTAALKLKQANLDSALAKQSKRGAENLDMFADQQALCSWLHDSVALHPFSRPTEADKEAAEAGAPKEASFKAKVTRRRLLSNATAPLGVAHRRLQESDLGLNSRTFDALQEGKNSGLDVMWASVSSDASTLSVSVASWAFSGITVMCWLGGGRQ